MIITLANLKDAPSQAVFDQVATHLLTQKQMSLDKSGKCVYRGEYGLKCAAGCLIADSEYVKAMDEFDTFTGTSWMDLAARKLRQFTMHDDLIRDLQRVHDSRAVDVWPKHLALVAAKHGLSTEAICESL